jgi:hypothetical protein
MLSYSSIESSSRGKKLAMGMNYAIKDKSHPSIHAEHNAVYKLLNDNKRYQYIKKCDSLDIFVIRLSKNSTIGYSRPCRNCIIRLLKCELNINNIYYTMEDGSVKVEQLIHMLDSNLTKFSNGDFNKIRPSNAKKEDEHKINLKE